MYPVEIADTKKRPSLPRQPAVPTRGGRQFLATFRLLGGGQHRGQIPSQLEPEPTVIRSQESAAPVTEDEPDE
jgi:hypothetical protein